MHPYINGKAWVVFYSYEMSKLFFLSIYFYMMQVD